MSFFKLLLDKKKTQIYSFLLLNRCLLCWRSCLQDTFSPGTSYDLRSISRRLINKEAIESFFVEQKVQPSEAITCGGAWISKEVNAVDSTTEEAKVK